MSSVGGGMKAAAAVALAALAVSGCGGSGGVGSDDFQAGDVVTCRRLGGDAVFVEYANDGGGSKTVVQGLPGGGEADSRRAEGVAESAATKKARRANGWDDKTVRELIQMPDDNDFARNFGFEGTDAQIDAKRRSLREHLERMPSCLDEAREARPSDG